MFDEIEIYFIGKNFNLKTNNPKLPNDESNLCYQAYIEMKKAFPEIKAVSINLIKNIPIGSGLGGGSSNCANVMLGLCKLFNLKKDKKILKKIASSLGSDVSFFLDGGAQYGTGFGENLEKVSLPKIEHILIIIPEINISTSWAFKNLKNSLFQESTKSKFDNINRLKFSWKSMQKFFENDFESLVFRTYPKIGELKRKLLECGANYASLSGSGSTVFGIFNDFDSAVHAEKKFYQFKTYLVKPIKNRKII